MGIGIAHVRVPRSGQEVWRLTIDGLTGAQKTQTAKLLVQVYRCHPDNIRMGAPGAPLIVFVTAPYTPAELAEFKARLWRNILVYVVGGT